MSAFHRLRLPVYTPPFQAAGVPPGGTGAVTQPLDANAAKPQTEKNHGTPRRRKASGGAASEVGCVVPVCILLVGWVMGEGPALGECCGSLLHALGAVLQPVHVVLVFAR